MKLVLGTDSIPVDAVWFTRRLGEIASWRLLLPADARQLLAHVVDALAPDGKPAALKLADGLNDVTVAADLYLVGGETTDEGRHLLHARQAKFADDHLIPRRRFHTGKAVPKLENLFVKLKDSLEVTEPAREGLYPQTSWLVVQDGISDLELALQLVNQWQPVAAADRLACTGIRKWKVVSLNPKKHTSGPATKLPDDFEISGVGFLESSAARTEDCRQSVPLVRLGRHLVTSKWTHREWQQQLKKELKREPPLFVALKLKDRPNPWKGIAATFTDYFDANRHGAPGWHQWAEVIPDGWAMPTFARVHSAPPAQVFHGTVLPHAQSGYNDENVVVLKVAGFEPNYDHLPGYVVTPYSGVGGGGGLNLVPEDGTPGVAVYSGRPGANAYFLGNVRFEKARIPAPSLELTLPLALSPSKPWTLQKDKHLELLDLDGKVKVDFSSAGLVVTADGKPLNLTAKELAVKVDQPMKINGTEVQFS